MSSRAERFAPIASGRNTSGIKSISISPGNVIDVRGLEIFNKAQASQFLKTGISPRETRVQAEAVKRSEESFFKRIQEQFNQQSQALNQQLQSANIQSIQKSPTIPIQPQIQARTMTDSEQKQSSNFNLIPLVILGAGALFLLG